MIMRGVCGFLIYKNVKQFQFAGILLLFFFFFVKKVWGLYFKICYKCEINICEMYASYNVYLKYA